MVKISANLWVRPEEIQAIREIALNGKTLIEVYCLGRWMETQLSDLQAAQHSLQLSLH